MLHQQVWLKRKGTLLNTLLSGLTEIHRSALYIQYFDTMGFYLDISFASILFTLSPKTVLFYNGPACILFKIDFIYSLLLFCIL